MDSCDHPPMGRREWLGSRGICLVIALGAGLALQAGPARAQATVSEIEPNDTRSSATLVVVGDTATGVIATAQDVDWFAVDLLAGDVLDLDIDAWAAGSALDPVLLLVDPTGVDTLVKNDDEHAATLDSRIRYVVTMSGRHFVLLRDAQLSGGAFHTYSLRFEPGGPADPTLPFASGMGEPTAMAVSGGGFLFVVDALARRVLRLDPNVPVSPISELVDLSSRADEVFDIVYDGLGDLLVVGSTATETTVWRVDLAGNASVFASVGSQNTFYTALTVGPNGDVWVGDPLGRTIARYDPTGGLLGTVSVGGTSGTIADMAFSPTGGGELHFSNGMNQVYAMTGGVPQLVVQISGTTEGIAFDQDGYLYVGDGTARTVQLFDPAYQLVDDRLAITNLASPIGLTFGREPGGVMSARVFATSADTVLAGGGLVELDPSGIRAAGWRVGTDLLAITTLALADGRVGASYADTLEAQGTTGPLSWSVTGGGTLPVGLALDSATGVLSGVPEEAGTFALSFRVDDAQGFALRNLSLTVTTPVLSAAAAADGLLDPGSLSLDLERFLDLQGNRNGIYDVGDLRAHLRALGQLGPRQGTPVLPDPRVDRD